MELKLDLPIEPKKSLFRVVIGIFFFLIAIFRIIVEKNLKPFDWFYSGIFALAGIVHFVEGLGFPFERLFGKAYVLINTEFISLKASVFDKKQFVNWNEIQSINCRINNLIINKTDNTILNINLSKFEYF